MSIVEKLGFKAKLFTHGGCFQVTIPKPVVNALCPSDRKKQRIRVDVETLEKARVTEKARFVTEMLIRNRGYRITIPKLVISALGLNDGKKHSLKIDVELALRLSKISVYSQLWDKLNKIFKNRRCLRGNP